jgi:hypothetical protein
MRAAIAITVKQGVPSTPDANDAMREAFPSLTQRKRMKRKIANWKKMPNLKTETINLRGLHHAIRRNSHKPRMEKAKARDQKRVKRRHP